MPENFDEKAIRRFIELANEGSVQASFDELGKLGFRLHENAIHRTWLTGTEVYAMVYHVMNRVRKTDWSDFTAAAGLQSKSFLSKATIPANSVQRFTKLSQAEVTLDFYDTPCDYIGRNLFGKGSGLSRCMDILDCVIDVWKRETTEFLSHTSKEAPRFAFASLFPIDPLLAPMADYFIFGERLKNRYVEAKRACDKDAMDQCSRIARMRTIGLFKFLSSTTNKPYSLPSEESLDRIANSLDTCDTEKLILIDPDYRRAIDDCRKKGVGIYSYYSTQQLDAHGPGCPPKIGLVAYFSQKASEWLQSTQSEVESSTGKEAAPKAGTSIDIRYFQRISGWKNAIIDRKVDAGDDDAYEIEEADSYSNRYISQEMQTLEGEPYCLFKDFLLKKSARSLLIASDSGSGKTTIVRGISALVAQAHLDEEAKEDDFIKSVIPSGIDEAECLKALSDYIPVIISQPSFAEVGRYKDTYDAITGIADSDVFLEALYSLLPSGKNGFASLDEFKKIVGLGSKILFVVDSIDEVPAPRMNYIDQLAKLVQEYDFGKVLITSRHLTNRENTKLKAINDSLSPSSPIVKILPLDEQRQKALLEKVAGKGSALEDLRCFPGASDILSNPLVLVAMARYRNDCAGIHMLVDEALRSAKTMLASLGSLPTGDAVNEKIQEIAFRSLEANGCIRFDWFSEAMKQAIRESSISAENDDSYADSLLQGILWRSGLFTIRKGGLHDYIDFRYEALKGWWASEYIYRRFDEDLSSRVEELPSKFAGTISCFRSLMEGATRMGEASRLAVLCSIEKIAPNEGGNFLVVEDHEDDLRLWVIKAISERVFLYSDYPESSDLERDFAKRIYEDVSSFGFTEGIKGFCLKN